MLSKYVIPGSRVEIQEIGRKKLSDQTEQKKT